MYTDPTMDGGFFRWNGLCCLSGCQDDRPALPTPWATRRIAETGTRGREPHTKAIRPDQGAGFFTKRLNIGINLPKTDQNALMG